MSWLADLLDRNSSDPRMRLELGGQLLAQLQTNRLPADSKLLNDFSDLTMQWLGASNYKVALLAVELLDVAVEVSGDVVAPYLLERLAALVERLGDSKQSVRDAAAQLLTDVAGLPATSPAVVLDKISAGLAHRQWLVRAGTMLVLRNLLDLYKAEIESQVNRLVPTICRLLADPNSEVREVATTTLVYIFCTMGEACAQSVQKRQLVPENRLAMLMQRYEETLRSGGPTASTSSAGRMPRATTRRLEPLRNWKMFRKPEPPPTNGRQGTNGAGFGIEDAENFLVPSYPPSRAISVPANKRVPGGVTSTPAGSSIAVTARNAGSAGAVKDDDFKKAFTQVPKCEVTSAKELAQKMEQIRATLANANLDWDRRVNSLKMLRAVCLHGGMDYEEALVTELLTFEAALLTSVKDLRSQVCREACITVSYLCETFDIRIVKVVEAVLPPLLNLIQNSAKVMASSASLACQYVVRNVQTPKILPVVATGMSSKSREIRRQTTELIVTILQSWDPKLLERSFTLIIDSIKSGLNDADPGARTAARNAYQLLDQNFPKQAQYLFQTLDPSKQKALQGHVSQSSSSQSIVSEKDSYAFTHRPGTFGLQKQKSYYAGRSTSEIDPTAARRALFTPQRVKPPVAPGSYMARKTPQRVVSATPTRPTATPLKPSSASNSSGAISQPGSRSNSPSRLTTSASSTAVPGVLRKFSGSIMRPPNLGATPPRRGPALRDPSPKRFGLGGTSSLASRVNGGGSRVSDDANFLTDDFAKLGIDSEDGLGSRHLEPALASALAAMASNSAEEKRRGVKAIQAIAKSGTKLDANDLKRVTDSMNKLIQEGNHKVMPVICEVLIDMARAWNDQLESWVYVLLHRLFAKAGNEILPTAQNMLKEAMAGIRTAFDPNVQLLAVSRYIQDPVTLSSPKAKCAALDYLHELSQVMGSTTVLNKSEVRSAIVRIFNWINDPKNQTNGLAQKGERAIADLFALNTSDFSAILATLPNEWKEQGLQLLKASSPTTNGFSARDELSEMSAQINEYVTSRTSQSLAASPSARNTSNGGTASFSTARSFQTTSFNSSSGNDSASDIRALTPVEDTTYLARDVVKQNEVINEFLGELNNPDRDNKKARVTALHRLSQMLADGSLTLWEQHFKSLLFALMEQMKIEDEMIQKLSLKLLSKICLAQAARFYELAEMCLFRVLQLSASKTTAVATAADECGRVLVTHLPTNVCIRTLHSLITTQDEPRIPGALKMLTRGVESMDAEEVLRWLPDVAPAVVSAYHHESSGVRKAAVFCLVALMNKVPEELKPYLEGLEKAKLTLLDVYVQRAQTSSNHF